MGVLHWQHHSSQPSPDVHVQSESAAVIALKEIGHFGSIQVHPSDKGTAGKDEVRFCGWFGME